MGRGYGSAAIRAMLDHAFGPLGQHKVWVMNFKTNTRSLAINQRIGFIEEGVLREEYFHKDTWHDMVRMSILAREWSPK